MVGVGVPSDGGAGPGEGGEGGAADGELVTLTGNVQLLFDNGRFDSGEVFADNATLESSRADGKLLKAAWNGNDPFSLAGLPADEVSWILITPASTANDAEVTYEPVVADRVDAAGRMETDVALARRSNLETIFDNLSTPLQRDDNAAQIVLRFENKQGGALTGITVKATAAAAIAYSVSGGYSDLAVETDGTGVAVLLNVPGAKFPGAVVNLQVSGAKTGGSRVLAVSGAVTLVTLVF